MTNELEKAAGREAERAAENALEYIRPLLINPPSNSPVVKELIIAAVRPILEQQEREKKELESVEAYALESRDSWKERAESAEQQLAQAQKKLEQQELNPRVGTCVDCGGSVWQKQERIEDETGLYHPLCRVTKRARSAEQQLEKARELLREVVVQCGPEPYSTQKTWRPDEELIVEIRKALASQSATPAQKCITCDCEVKNAGEQCPACRLEER